MKMLFEGTVELCVLSPVLKLPIKKMIILSLDRTLLTFDFLPVAEVSFCFQLVDNTGG